MSSRRPTPSDIKRQQQNAAVDAARAAEIRAADEIDVTDPQVGRLMPLVVAEHEEEDLAAAHLRAAELLPTEALEAALAARREAEAAAEQKAQGRKGRR